MSDRCGWVGSEDIYIRYHDEEWGVPVTDPRALWEKLILDGFQAGLSWITILKKRAAFQEAFEGFEPERIARWGEPEVARLLTNPGIVRHRGKIEATIRNARAYLDMEEDFASYLWGWVDGKPVQTDFATLAEVPPQTPLSAEISKDLKRRGFGFCGPTIVYAFMEATGFFNDHVVGCHRHGPIRALGEAMSPVPAP